MWEGSPGRKSNRSSETQVFRFHHNCDEVLVPALRAKVALQPLPNAQAISQAPPSSRTIVRLSMPACPTISTIHSRRNLSHISSLARRLRPISMTLILENPPSAWESSQKIEQKPQGFFKCFASRSTSSRLLAVSGVIVESLSVDSVSSDLAGAKFVASLWFP